MRAGHKPMLRELGLYLVGIEDCEVDYVEEQIFGRFPRLLGNTVVVGHHIARVNKTHVAVITFSS
jgi:hypothetical protein